MDDHSNKSLTEGEDQFSEELQTAPPTQKLEATITKHLKETNKVSRIHITGASGSGVSTLGVNLASVLSLPVFDVDTYFWLPTDPQFTTKRSDEERIALLKPDVSKAQEESGGWVLSGAMGSWGEEVMNEVEHVIFIHTTRELRMKRLREREFKRFGKRIQEGGDMYEKSVEFLEWAEAYDDREMGKGRSRLKQEMWLRELSIPVTRLSGDQDELLVLRDALKALGKDVEGGELSS